MFNRLIIDTPIFLQKSLIYMKQVNSINMTPIYITNLQITI